MSAEPIHATFDRRPPAGLEADGVPMSEVLRALATTTALFEAFSWRLRPLGNNRRFIWDPEKVGNDMRVSAETSDSCASVVLFDINGDLEILDNDLDLLSKLLVLHRDHGIGRFNVDRFIVAMKDLILQAAEHDPRSMSIETFAALAVRWSAA